MVEVVNLPAVTAVLDAVAPSFEQLARLHADWDSYGADPIAPEAIEAAKRLVRLIAVAHSRLPIADLTPHIVPLADGGVQAEWAGSAGRLEVEFGGKGAISFLIVQGHGAEERYEERHGATQEAVVSAAGRVFGAA